MIKPIPEGWLRMSDDERKAVQAQLDAVKKTIDEQLANIIMQAAISKAKAL